jgi:hypothetical protein
MVLGTGQRVGESMCSHQYVSFLGIGFFILE